MFKKLLLITSSGLLKITLFFLAVVGAAWITFSTPGAPKKALEESGVYTDVVGTVLQETQKSVEKEGDNSIPINEPDIQAVVTNAFPPDFLQQNVEGVIDGVYAWLQGTTETPEFTIDITGAKQNVIDGAADYAVKRFEGLPVCTLEQLRSLGAKIDPFHAPCRPPGLSSAQVRTEAAAQLTKQDEFLKDTVITSESLPKDESGKTVFDNVEAAPDIFQMLSWLPWVLGLLALLFGTSVVYLSETKRRGVKSIGITLVGTGVFLLLGSLLINFVFDQANQPGKLVQEGNAFNANIIRGLQSIMDTYNKTLMNYYIVYIVLGTAILLTLWYQDRQKTTASAKVPQNKSRK